VSIFKAVVPTNNSGTKRRKFKTIGNNKLTTDFILLNLK
jgi:hypothetical protein